MKKPHFLIRYLIEGVLIFASVYGAFLLEDHRSKKEQEQLFAKRWSGLIKWIEIDSQKLSALTNGMTISPLDGGEGLNYWVR